MTKLLARVRLCLVGLAAFLPAACNSEGHFTFLGYTTQPTYDPGIRTVYVPIFQNITYARGVEFDLTRAIIREIESKTPFKVVDSASCADTELIGKIVTMRKGAITLSQLGEVRDVELNMGVELVWRDLRPGSTGVILSINRKKEEVRGEDVPPPGKDAKTPPVLVTPSATYVPELGGSQVAAQKMLVDRTATQIVSLMEKGW